MHTSNNDDMINHPKHYTFGKFEVIDVLKNKLTPEEFSGYLLGNCYKYQMRARHKNNRIQDLKKAKWYLDKLIETLEENPNSGY